MIKSQDLCERIFAPVNADDCSALDQKHIMLDCLTAVYTAAAASIHLASVHGAMSLREYCG